MKTRDIQLLEILHLKPEDGTIWLKDQRMVLQSAAALGLLRKELITALGVDPARRLLLRTGFAHGYRDALNMGRRFGSAPPRELVEIGCTVHTIEGHVRVEPLQMEYDPERRRYHMEARWHNCFEAEQHREHFGLSREPVCWAMTGYASGYASACLGADVYYKEVKCAGRGDPYCHVIGRDANSWDTEADALRDGLTAFDLRSQLEVLADLRAQLKALERDREALRRGRRHVSIGGRDPEADALRAEAAQLAESERFIVRSARMADAIQLAMRVAPLDTTVLVTGESGTGKEFTVRLIHNQSRRRFEPFVPVNCAALTDTLLESELFGHVRGAFTGAVRNKPGLFQQAGSGTLFLDEIGEMPLALQAKLLRALEHREIRRVGGDHTIKVRSRVIAATNRDLRAAVAEGAFREDLFYRLSAFVIELPPLRERREEIAPLAHEFVGRAARSMGKRPPSVSPEAMTCLVSYDWPGNVRELQHALERAVIVSRDDVIERRDLPSEIVERGVRDTRLRSLTERQEVLAIEAALREHDGNRAAAARALRISPVTLWRKMKRYGVELPNGTAPFHH